MAQEPTPSGEPRGRSIDVVLHIMETALSGVDAASSSHDDKGLFVAASSTAIVALVSTSLTNFSWYICLLYFLIYMSVLATSFLVYRPMDFKLPSADPIQAKKDFIDLPENVSKKNLLDILELSYSENIKLKEEKCKWMTRSLNLLNVLIVSSVLLLFYPVFFKKVDNHARKPTTTADPLQRATAAKPNTAKPKPALKSTVRPKQISGAGKKS